ncbi:MAG: efflux RND transporter permease subunit [Acidobacteriota bacterium]
MTYPIVSALLGAPHVRAVRAISDFGTSLVYVIFDDDTDIYWARSRTQEYLASVLPRLPEGVKTELGPDATSLGWVFQYVLLDRSGKQSLADLRSWQDWYLAYWLKSVPGVAEVASLGGFVKQYQVNLDPDSLRTHNIPIRNVVEALQSGNANTGGRVMESGGAEYMVRGLGAAHSVADLENTLVSYSTDEMPYGSATWRKWELDPTSGAASPIWMDWAKWSPGSS